MTNAPEKPMPVTVSSLGRAVLAWQPPATIDAVIAAVGPHRLTAKTIPHHRLRAELDDTRQRGYAVNDQGTTVEKRSVAAPVRGVSGRTIAAINISVPARRVSLDTLERVLAPRLLSTAATLSSTVPPGVRGAGSLTVRPR
jgi:IclR family pca regulon transcriptional regulator